MTEPTISESTTSQTKGRPPPIVGLSIAVIAILAVGGGVAFALATQSARDRQPVASIEQPAVPEQPAPVPEPTRATIPLPTDCRKIYTEAFLEEYANIDLNHVGVRGTPVSRFRPIEGIREMLPGISCQWGGPTEGGIYSAVNAVTPNVEVKLIAAAAESGFTCEERDEDTTLCRHSTTFPEDETNPNNTTIWTVAEDVYLRDGVVITTWFAGTGSSIDAVTQPIYDTLWP